MQVMLLFMTTKELVNPRQPCSLFQARAFYFPCYGQWKDKAAKDIGEPAEGTQIYKRQ